MVRTLLVRGMIAGLVAGLAYSLFAVLFGEPPVEAAIGYQDRVAAAAGQVSTAPPLVSRGIQRTLGLATAALVYGVVVGGILSLAYASVAGRVGRLSPRATAAVIAGIGFVSVVLVPFVTYPPNPPGSTLDTTVGPRTGYFAVLIILSVLLAVGAVMLGRSLAVRMDPWNATLAAAAAYLVAVGIVGFLLPTVAETPADYPAVVFYEFRAAAIGGQLVLWTAVGLTFGALIDGRSRRRSASTADTVAR